MSIDVDQFLPDFVAVRLRLALLLHRARVGWSEGGAMLNFMADAFSDRGALLKQADALEAALDNLNDALLLSPHHRLALNNRGAVLTDLGRPAEALIDFDAGLRLDPYDTDLWTNRGNALIRLGRLEEAVKSHDCAIAIEPGRLATLLPRAVALHYLRRFDDSLADFAVVRGARPDDPGARYNASQVYLTIGNYETGWALYESRWAMHPTRAEAHDRHRPRWQGETGGTVLLWSEQGSGDTLQFCRYAALVAQRNKVVLEVPRSLVRLLRGLPHVDAVVAEDDPLPEFDWHCPMMSLPLAFGTRVETIPADIPYLRADPSQIAYWNERLAALPSLHVGLVWSGNPRPDDPTANAIDCRRSITAEHYQPLSQIPGVTLVSLQKSEDSAAAGSLSSGPTFHDWTDELHDFADTAALIMALDLVITVDTSVAHLAGAIGKPVWILNRYDACWRWLDGRTNSPWYPTARLFRQPAPGDWHSVIQEVASALAREALPALSDIDGALSIERSRRQPSDRTPASE